MLGYDTKRGVFEEWLGTELAATRKRAADLYSQLVLAEKNKDAQYAPIVSQLQADL